MNVSSVLSWMIRRKYLVGIGAGIGLGILLSWWIFNIPGKALSIPYSSEHTGYDVQFRPQGDLIAASVDNRCEIWDVATQRHVMTLQPPEGVGRIAWSPNGTLLALAGSGLTINIFDHQGEFQGSLKGSYTDGRTSNIAWIDERHIVATYGNTIQVWDVSIKTVQMEQQFLHTRISAIAISPHDTVIAVVDILGYVVIWNWVTDEILLKQKSISEVLHAVEFSPDGTQVALGGHNKLGYSETAGMVEVWNTEGERITSLEAADVVRTVRFHPYRNLVLFGTGGFYDNGFPEPPKDTTVRLWNLETGTEFVLADLKNHQVYALDISPDGNTVAAASHGAGVRLFDISE